MKIQIFLEEWIRDVAHRENNPWIYTYIRNGFIERREIVIDNPFPHIVRAVYCISDEKETKNPLNIILRYIINTKMKGKIRQDSFHRHIPHVLTV